MLKALESVIEKFRVVNERVRHKGPDRRLWKEDIHSRDVNTEKYRYCLRRGVGREHQVMRLKNLNGQSREISKSLLDL